MIVYDVTKKEALQYITDIASLSQGIGTLGARLSKCKPGTKLYQKVWDKMTAFENERSEKSAALREAIKFGCHEE